jgi:hypothetical protein
MKLPLLMEERSDMYACAVHLAGCGVHNAARAETAEVFTENAKGPLLGQREPFCVVFADAR